MVGVSGGDGPGDLSGEEIEAMVGDLARRSIDATARRLEAESPAPQLIPTIRPRIPFRVYVYGAAAAAGVVAVVFGVAAFGGPDTVPVETAAPVPTTSSTSTTTTTTEPVDPIDAQLEADSAIAAQFGLSIGSLLDDPQPDLTPVIETESVVAYLLVADRGAFSDAEAFVSYGPDGTTIRGVWSETDGFTRIDEDPALPDTLGSTED